MNKQVLITISAITFAFVTYSIYRIWGSFLYVIASEKCADMCHPYYYDVYDTESCACWMPNGELKVMDIE